MSGISIDPEELDAAASTIRQSASKVQELAEYARDADPDVWAWGLPATMLAAPFYIGLVEQLHQQFEGAVQTVEGFAKMIEDCAEEARRGDDGNVQLFLDLEGELDGDYSGE
ncbi:hypothetical protein [Glycomyces salinus]|uniref:hypothetical protein n=1 Tax=Glycomyces salinus TaxID=980294 RepID=UPI0018ECA75B|nr:hypothetical protein [Glycomyces salinus]